MCKSACASGCSGSCSLEPKTLICIYSVKEDRHYRYVVSGNHSKFNGKKFISCNGQEDLLDLMDLLYDFADPSKPLYNDISITTMIPSNVRYLVHVVFDWD